MKKNKKDNLYPFLVGLILILLLPAYFLKIQLLTLIPDEAIRTLVALEMKLSGDYITPAMGGEFYFKKPPVFNWIIAAYFNLTGDYSERASRLPMLFSLFGYALTIFLVVKNKYGIRIGFVTSMLFLATLRIILYESLFGLLDMTFSWIIFVNFILIYELFRKNRLFSLFLVSYALTALGFLLKGLPAIAFQGITLLIIFIINKQFLRLLSWKHFVGTLTLWIIIGSYFFAYYRKNPDQFNTLLLTLFHESADKSAVAFGFWDIFKHIFTYSAEVIYNFVPATFFIFFLFRKKPFKYLNTDPFLKYLLLVFIFNLSIFLVSPTTFQRYVLPLIPLLMIVFVMYYYHYKSEGASVHLKIIDTIILLFGIIICLGQLVFPLVPRLHFVEYRWIKAFAMFVLLLTGLTLLYNKPQFRPELFILTVLVFRISFNFFILPSRTHGHWQVSMREKSIEIGKQLKDEELYIYDHLVTTTHYYLTVGKQDIIPINNDTTHSGYGLVPCYKGEYANKDVIFDHRIAGPKDYLKIFKWK